MTDTEIAEAVYGAPTIDVVTGDGHEFAPNTNVSHAFEALEHVTHGRPTCYWVVGRENAEYQVDIYFQLRIVVWLSEDTLAKAVATAAATFAK